MKMKYFLSFELVEDNYIGVNGETAEEYCKELCKYFDKQLSPYARKKYPTHYLPHYFKDNYGPGKDWNGFIVWYHYGQMR